MKEREVPIEELREQKPSAVLRKLQCESQIALCKSCAPRRSLLNTHQIKIFSVLSSSVTPRPVFLQRHTQKQATGCMGS